MQTNIQIHRVSALEDMALLGGLSELLVDCVDGGASVSFMQPLSQARAENFWRSLAASVAAGERILLTAQDQHGAVLGTVQVVLSQPENQPHRADVAKLLVHRKARKQGLGEKLMIAAEQAAAGAGKSVLVLDTASDSAERLYKRLGWQVSGVIPDYALLPQGGLCATTIFYKNIGTGGRERSA
ncbi:acetyltransferase (GNAT) family protein [Collimonas sp. PA-H2]|uniref:GNAT family N-acetyltransferase n=1 Tax=Collimonas sp. PA-H2 TaxID=1881062 RepID=UPI000BF34A75|nr:GNAT family N-acetyltransferase [Collimonas sp. PA-H2]PFH11897.1 acetyltransferase (GNAT) family protein [Collimonas sp. PA-H2]